MYVYITARSVDEVPEELCQLWQGFEPEVADSRPDNSLDSRQHHEKQSDPAICPELLLKEDDDVLRPVPVDSLRDDHSHRDPAYETRLLHDSVYSLTEVYRQSNIQALRLKDEDKDSCDDDIKYPHRKELPIEGVPESVDRDHHGPRQGSQPIVSNEVRDPLHDRQRHLFSALSERFFFLEEEKRTPDFFRQLANCRDTRGNFRYHLFHDLLSCWLLNY